MTFKTQHPRQIPQLNLGGTDQSVAPTNRQFVEYMFEVDAGGSQTELEGIDAIATQGMVVTLIRIGAEQVNLPHQDSNATNPFYNSGTATINLTASGHWVKYLYDGTDWVEQARSQKI